MLGKENIDDEVVRRDRRIVGIGKTRHGRDGDPRPERDAGIGEDVRGSRGRNHDGEKNRGSGRRRSRRIVKSDFPRSGVRIVDVPAENLACGRFEVRRVRCAGGGKMERRESA